jgi:hypothetical protein
MEATMQLMTVKEAVVMSRRSESTLARWRNARDSQEALKAKGLDLRDTKAYPRYIKMGGSIFYEANQLTEDLKAMTH